MEKIGLQLYSIKELTEEDFFGTLQEVAKIGYDGVEFAGFFDAPSSDLKKVLEDSGIVACGSHTGIDALQDDLNKVIDYNLEIGNKYVICPGLPPHMRDSYEAYMKLAKQFNEIGAKCKDQGIQFGYHNHDFEFEKFQGEYGLDILLSNTNPELVHMELDTFWVEYAGLRSLDFMRKYPKQHSSLIHIKDMNSWDNKVNTEIGNGVMDFVAITDLAKELGTKWYIVEQEEFEISQLESIEKSLKYLRSIL
ncbi:MAG TPA: sugar phosphate isomerase/epimerase [Clostridia bacterium]|nr:sugar phosphate isomerase/epimerase [Clostridia bacterium]